MREQMGRVSGVVKAVECLEQILARKSCVPRGPLDACDLLLNSLRVSIRHRPRVGEEAAGPQRVMHGTATIPHTLTAHATTADSGCMTTDRLPNNQEAREVYLREHNAATFIEAVNNSRRDSVDTVIMTVKAFAGEPDVLYVALDYAYHSGMSVTMAADPGQDEPSS
jgi:hypothetical protein